MGGREREIGEGEEMEETTIWCAQRKSASVTTTQAHGTMLCIRALARGCVPVHVLTSATRLSLAAMKPRIVPYSTRTHHLTHAAGIADKDDGRKGGEVGMTLRYPGQPQAIRSKMSAHPLHAVTHSPVHYVTTPRSSQMT